MTQRDMKAFASTHFLHLTCWLSLIFLSACSIIPATEALTIYRLPSSLPPPAAAANRTAPEAFLDGVSLRVATPDATTYLDSSRIAVAPSADLLTNYKGARWSERAPLLLRNQLYDALDATGKISALSLDENSVHADFELTGTLRSFQSEYHNGQAVIVIRYDALLTSTSAHRILAARRFDMQQPAASEAVPDVIQSFGQASDRLSAQVVPWVLGTLQKEAKKP
jgi:cholesterol transport system auxiliary component